MNILIEKCRQCFEVAELPIMFLGVVLALIWMVSMSPGFPKIEELTELKVLEIEYFHARSGSDELIVSDSVGAKYRLVVGAMSEDDLKRLFDGGGQWRIWFRLTPSVLYKNNRGGIYQIEVDGVQVLSLEESKRIIEGRVGVFDMWFLLSVGTLLFLYVIYRCFLRRG